MTRGSGIGYPDLDAPSPSTARVLDKIRSGRPFVPNVYRMLLWSPQVTDGWVSLANAVRFETDLPERDRELVVLLVSHLAQAEYEWHHHEQIAPRAGIVPQELDAIRRYPDLDGWTSEDQSLLRLVGAMVLGSKVPEGDVDALVARLGERMLVELVATASYYLGLARFLTVFDVQIETG